MAKRYILFVVSLFFSALGVAITKRAELGVSPISSVPNVISLQFTEISFGYWLIVWNCVLVLGQILLLRKRFQPIQLLQIPLSFVFGWFTDFGVWITSFWSNEFYALRLFYVVLGTVTLGFGIALSVIADVIMNAGEAFVRVVSDTTHKDFGSLKIVFDVLCVVLSIILSLVFFDFTIVGTREGTVIAALLTGFLVKILTKPLRKPLEKLLA